MDCHDLARHGGVRAVWQAAEQGGLPAPLRAKRRERLQTMKAMLARLLAQRANAVSEAPVGKDARKGAA